jgi:hypothetical protein
MRIEPLNKQLYNSSVFSLIFALFSINLVKFLSSSLGRNICFHNRVLYSIYTNLDAKHPSSEICYRILNNPFTFIH